jgi:SAM-dependent methyltransferase
MAVPAATITAISDSNFAGVNRPLDTSWAEGAIHRMDLQTGLALLAKEWHGRTERDINYRAQELSLYFEMPCAKALRRLERGFFPAHDDVAIDFRSHGVTDDASLLDWYMKTNAYIWELSAYHLDPGFNYKGMCSGIVERLRAWRKHDILVLGDGIGDLCLDLNEAATPEMDLRPTYHDLQGSRTAEFAQFRFHINADPPISTLWTTGWEADLGFERWDAIIALDFFEHLTEVEQWVRAVYKGLRPGGFLMAQNAFACGDDEHGGSIPMHLVRNNRFEFDWTPLLEDVGFTHDVAEWWVK